MHETAMTMTTMKMKSTCMHINSITCKSAFTFTTFTVDLHVHVLLLLLLLTFLHLTSYIY